MRIIWLVWQSETSKFLDTEFDHARWSATFIFDAKKNATIGEDWPEWQRIGDDSLTRNLTVLNQLKTDNQWHCTFAWRRAALAATLVTLETLSVAFHRVQVKTAIAKVESAITAL